MLVKLVPSYETNSKIVDHIYEEQLNFKNDVKMPPAVKEQEKKIIKFKNK